PLAAPGPQPSDPVLARYWTYWIALMETTAPAAPNCAPRAPSAQAVRGNVYSSAPQLPRDRNAPAHVAGIVVRTVDAGPAARGASGLPGPERPGRVPAPGSR